MNAKVTYLIQSIRRFMSDCRRFPGGDPLVPVVPVIPTDRDGLFSEWHDLQARRSTEAEAHSRAVQPLVAELEQLAARQHALQYQLATLESARQQQQFTDSSMEDKLRVRLLDTAPGCIDRLVEEIDMELGALRRKEPTVLRGAQHDGSGKKVRTIETDAPGIQRRVKALLAARTQAENLRLDDRPIEEIVHKVNHLRLSLPAIETETIRGHLVSVYTS
jgi:hypothetical protein